MGRRLGQHFLHNPATLNAVVQAAAPGAGEAVLEIGPGEGALTERLLAAGARVTAVELDEGLLAGLRERFAGEAALSLRAGDVLALELAPQALFGAPAPYAVVANLPYYLSSPLLLRFVASRDAFSRLVLMVQKEVAQRMAAGPARGKQYGSLSIAVQTGFAVERLFDVAPGAFRPPPQVTSSVVRLVPQPRELAGEEEAAFLEHVKGLFTRRRKRMLSVLRPWQARVEPATWEAVAERVGERRCEALTPAEHLALFRLLSGGAAATDDGAAPEGDA